MHVAPRSWHPEDDEERLRQWVGFVAQSPVQIEGRLRCSVSGSVEGLVEVWAAARALLAVPPYRGAAAAETLALEPADLAPGPAVSSQLLTPEVLPPRAAPPAPEAFPDWARWPDLAKMRHNVTPAAVALHGELAAHYANVFMSRAGSPNVGWEIYRERSGRMFNEAEPVLARSELRRRRGAPPRLWMSPLADVAVVMSREARFLETGVAILPGQGDSAALRDTLQIRLSAFM